jgi:hypothetical protein
MSKKIKSTWVLAIALLLTSGCLTPKPIKQVSNDIKSGVGVYTATVDHDLEATEKFMEDARDALNAERGRVTQSLGIARDMAQIALDEKLKSAKTNLMLRFETKAYHIMTVEFRGAVEARLVPLIQPQIERFRERERATRAASEADPRSALAAKEYLSRVIEHNAFLVKAKNIELECYKLMQQELDQARLEYLDLVNT